MHTWRRENPFGSFYVLRSLHTGPLRIVLTAPFGSFTLGPFGSFAPWDLLTKVQTVFRSLSRLSVQGTVSKSMVSAITIHAHATVAACTLHYRPYTSSSHPTDPPPPTHPARPVGLVRTDCARKPPQRFSLATQPPA